MGAVSSTLTSRSSVPCQHLTHQVWGNSTWAPDDTEDVTSRGRTFGTFMAASQQQQPSPQKSQQQICSLEAERRRNLGTEVSSCMWTKDEGGGIDGSVAQSASEQEEVIFDGSAMPPSMGPQQPQRKQLAGPALLVDKLKGWIGVSPSTSPSEASLNMRLYNFEEAVRGTQAQSVS